MYHDPELLDRLSGYTSIQLACTVYRTTRLNLDPLAPSNRGGRWAPCEEFQVLYTSCSEEGAIAELAHHWLQLTPIPTKPIMLHRIEVTTKSSLRLMETDLETLGLVMEHYSSSNYDMTQKIGAAVQFLEHDGLIVPSARWPIENVVLFTQNHGLDERLSVVDERQVDWRRWAADNGWL